MKNNVSDEHIKIDIEQVYNNGLENSYYFFENEANREKSEETEEVSA